MTSQKLGYGLTPLRRRTLAVGDEDQVIHVPGIATNVKFTFDEAIDRVQVDAGEQLTHEMPYRHTGGFGALSEFPRHAQRGLALDAALQQCSKHVSVDAVEKFADIDMQGVGAGRGTAHHALHRVSASMRSTARAAGIARGGESSVEYWEKRRVQRVLHDEVTKVGRFDQAELGLTDVKSVRGVRLIRAAPQLAMQCSQLSTERALEPIAGSQSTLALPG